MHCLISRQAEKTPAPKKSPRAKGKGKQAEDEDDEEEEEAPKKASGRKSSSKKPAAAKVVLFFTYLMSAVLAVCLGGRGCPVLLPDLCFFQLGGAGLLTRGAFRFVLLRDMIMTEAGVGRRL